MANFTLPHIRIQASGTLGSGGGNEIWTFGYKIGCTDVSTPTVLEIPTQDDLVSAANHAVTNVSALMSKAGGGPESGLISIWGAFTELKASAIGPDSKVDSALNTVITDVIPPVRGQAVVNNASDTYGQIPYQVAVVVTLRGSQYTRGPAAFGRFYLPVPNIFTSAGAGTPTPMVDGLMGAAAVQRFADAGQLLVQNSQVLATGSGHYQGVWNISTSQVQNQVRAQRVSAVSVDNRPDTVRRRSNKISGQGEIREEIS